MDINLRAKPAPVIPTGIMAMGRDKLPRDLCQYCQKRLPDDRDPKRIFCSVKCRRDSYQQMLVESLRLERVGKTCRSCGKPFDAEHTKRQIFCDLRCKVSFHNAMHARRSGSICRQCSKPFVKQHGRQVYCSVRCRIRHSANRKRDEIRRQLRHTVRRCRQCGKRFEARARGHQKFCGRPCAKAFHNIISNARIRRPNTKTPRPVRPDEWVPDRS